MRGARLAVSLRPEAVPEKQGEGLAPSEARSVFAAGVTPLGPARTVEMCGGRGPCTPLTPSVCHCFLDDCLPDKTPGPMRTGLSGLSRCCAQFGGRARAWSGEDLRAGLGGRAVPEAPWEGGGEVTWAPAQRGMGQVPQK